MKTKIADDGTWKTKASISEKERYHRYLTSREWSLLKNQVKARSGGICERCRANESDAVHHLTYKRKYRESLEDLQDICEGCHNFTHGKSDVDPAELPKKIVVEPPHDLKAEQHLLHMLFQSPGLARTIFGVVSPDDFYRVSHRAICSTLFSLGISCSETGYMNILEELSERDADASNDFNLIVFGEHGFDISADYACECAERIYNHAFQRKLIVWSERIIDLVQSGSCDVDKLLEIGERELFRISSEHHARRRRLLASGYECPEIDFSRAL